MSDDVDIVCVLGTRPEIIKFAPVVRALRADATLATRVIGTGQQADLVGAFLHGLDVAIDDALDLMRAEQSVLAFLRRATSALDRRLAELAPRAVLVQGDTATAFAGALAAALRAIPVVHIEAGLRTHVSDSPYPEEALRVMITHLASLHLAATSGNRANLEAEGIAAADIIETGNPVVDAVEAAASAPPTPRLRTLLEQTAGHRRVVLTCHRRENFGGRMEAYFRAIARFVASTPDTALVFPVHPNPKVRKAAAAILGGRARVHLVEPLDYETFLGVVRHADLVLSDSGGIQEEAASLGTPLVVLRSVTERPEALDAGVAELAPDATALEQRLDRLRSDGWPGRRRLDTNPFGDGASGPRIAAVVRDFVRARTD